MTLPEKLAAEALPCNCQTRSGVIGLALCWSCIHRPAVEAAIRKAIRECEVIADMDASAYCDSCEQIRAEIEMLQTQETP